jgi:hypothetical protein
MPCSRSHISVFAKWIKSELRAGLNTRRTWRLFFLYESVRPTRLKPGISFLANLKQYLKFIRRTVLFINYQIIFMHKKPKKICGRRLAIAFAGLCATALFAVYLYKLKASLSRSKASQLSVIKSDATLKTPNSNVKPPKALTLQASLVQAKFSPSSAIKPDVTARTLIATMLTEKADDYGIGSVMLLRSIKRRTTLVSKTDFRIIELESKPIQDHHLRSMLEEEGWSFMSVPRIPPRDEGGTNGNFKDQFTKLHLWNLTQYTDRILYLDSDCLVSGKLDELLVMNISAKPLWAARDIRDGSWRETFNMGVFMIRPSSDEYRRLIQLKDDTSVRFETIMAEQGFLNVVYKNQWGDIGFRNNANLAAYSTFKNQWDLEKSSGINVIHFTMSKPWWCNREYQEICDLWNAEKNAVRTTPHPRAN